MYDQNMAAFYETDAFDLLSDSHDKVLSQLQSNNAAPLSMLDAGCGTGLFLEKLAGIYKDLQLTGADLSVDMLDIARSKPLLTGLSSAICSIEDIDRHLEPQSFDLVTLHYVLCYVPAHIAFPAIAKLLKPGGLFSLTTMTKATSFPTLRQLSSFIEQDEIDALSNTPLSKEELEQYIISSGLFDVVAWDTLEKPISFDSKEQLSDFVFRSGWVSEVSEQYEPYINEALQHAAFPIPEHFSSEIVLLRVK